MGAGAGGQTGQTGGQGQGGGGSSGASTGGQARAKNQQYSGNGYFGDRGGGGAGASFGGQSQGQGGAGQAGAGAGEAGHVSFLYDVYNGEGALVAESGYDYDDRESARDAGLAIAVYPGYVVVKADKAGFGTSRYDAVPPLEEGVVVTTGPGGTTYTGQGDKPAKGKDGASGDEMGDNNWMLILVVIIILVAMGMFALKGGS